MNQIQIQSFKTAFDKKHPVQ